MNDLIYTDGGRVSDDCNDRFSRCGSQGSKRTESVPLTEYYGSSLGTFTSYLKNITPILNNLSYRIVLRKENIIAHAISRLYLEQTDSIRPGLCAIEISSICKY